MLSNYAILIDGAFLQHQLASKDAPMTAIAVRRLVGRLRGHEHLAGRELHRVYYYDAEAWGGVEEKPLGGGKIDFSAHPVKARNDALRKEIRRIPDVALRMGKTRFDGWELRQRILKKSGDKAEIQADDLRPKIRQKGVDMRIGLDIASLTLKRQARIIVLVSADTDFVPAMKFARREGARVYLVSFPLARLSDEMCEHADLVLKLDDIG